MVVRIIIIGDGALIDENKMVDAMVSAVRKKKKQERKPEKAQDAGARAKRRLQRKEYAAKVSGSENIVPDDLRDHKTWKDFRQNLS